MKIPAHLAAMLSVVCFAPFLHAQDDAKRTAAADELLKAMHANEMVAVSMAKQKENMKNAIASHLPKDLSPEALKQVQAAGTAALDTAFEQLSWESLKPDFIQIYSATFTEQELKEATAFYKSPIGMKCAEKMPEVQASISGAVQKRILAILPAVQTAVKDAIEKAKAAGDSGASPAQ